MDKCGCAPTLSLSLYFSPSLSRPTGHMAYPIGSPKLSACNDVPCADGKCRAGVSRRGGELGGERASEPRRVPSASSFLTCNSTLDLTHPPAASRLTSYDQTQMSTHAGCPW